MHLYKITKSKVLSNRNIIFITLGVLIPFLECKAQTLDHIFERGYYKCHQNGHNLKDEMVFFEAIKLEGKWVLSVIKGTHSKILYDQIYKTLQCIDADKVKEDSVRFIHYNRVPKDGYDFDGEKREAQDRLLKFRKLYDIDEDVEVLIIYSYPSVK